MTFFNRFRATAFPDSAGISYRNVPRWSATWVLALAALWLLSLIWVRPLALPDEGRYVGVAWEMVRSGNWLVPTIDGMPFFHKPPLFYWITATSLSVFGPQEWAVRLAPFLGGMACIASVFLLARRWMERPVAEITVLALATQPLLYLGAQYANLDMLVAGCISLTIALLTHATLRMDQGLPARQALWGAYATAGLGILAKGLIGFVLPGMVIVLGLLLAGRWRLIPRLFSLVGGLVLLAVAGPWFYFMTQEFPDFLHYFFIFQQFQRYTQTGFNNMQPWYFYVVIVGVCALFWWPVIIHRSGPFQGWWPERPTSDGLLRSVLLVWPLAILLFFSQPASKLVGYILPVMPPLALLAADGWNRLARARPRLGRIFISGIVVWGLFDIGAVIGITMEAPKSARTLSLALKEQRQPGEPVVMLERYVYDLTVYAQTESPAIVLDQWDDPSILRRDNWQRELLDAGEFWPEVAKKTLVLPTQFAQLLCASPVVWVVGTDAEVQNPDYAPWLKGVEPVATQKNLRLWKMGRSAQPVGQAPSCP
jgi:4-amino-4-deoxy-L-arabinose transferase-like glycosyltransferase